MTGNGRYGAAGRLLPLLLLLAAVAAGCSTAQDAGNLVDAQGNHPANFVSTHPSFAAPSGAACMPCHGGDLRGGISGVSCFTASRNGVACHASGPAFHPATWLDCTSVQRSRAAWHATAFADNLLVNGNTCAQCHTPPALDAVPSGKCVQCHFNMDGARRPAGSTWIHGTLDGHSAFNDNATARAVCMACHEAHNRFGQQPVCHNCHAPFPSFAGHVASWLDCTARGTNDWHATAYGNNFLINGKRCDQCHTLGVKCTTCHFDVGGRKVPVGSTYTHGSTTGHTAFYTDNAARAVCIACHETHNRFGQQPVCHNCHTPFPIPPGTHATGWLNSDNTTGFHGLFVGSVNCTACHPVTGHPTCTTCHFDANGSRAYAPLSFAHDVNVYTNHRSSTLATAAGTVCENCHQTSRTYRAGVPSCAPGGTGHPGSDGCHYNAALLDPVFANPRY